MHYTPCGLAWCPGDQKYEHEEVHQRSFTKRVRLGHNIKGGNEKGVHGRGGDCLKYDDGSGNGTDEWFLAGFPDSQE
jgi:hypothetical protein